MKWVAAGVKVGETEGDGDVHSNQLIAVKANHLYELLSVN